MLTLRFPIALGTQEADFRSRLTLTVATRIYLLEPQWNPLQESQAIGRAIRLGQKKQVKVVRYITRDTIEVELKSLLSLPNGSTTEAIRLQDGVKEYEMIDAT
ncbi:hypothetical protein SLS57_007071 [Botryosphaeria dothidea]